MWLHDEARPVGYRKFLFMGLIGIILAGFVNMFSPSGAMSFIISVDGVLIFALA